MGGGSAVRQHQRRFLQGEPEETGRKEECEGAYWMVKSFGGYEVRETEGGEYELVKGGIVIGTFSEARVEEERILFLLSRGMLLEVSEGGIREIATPDKAILMGMIASDGSNTFRREQRSEGGYRTEYSIRFYSEDKELVRTFDEVSEKTYDTASHHYVRKRNGLITATIYNKGVFYDLNDLGLKPAPYEFHVPIEHLDNEGKKAFLKGFFSGDGNVSVSEGRIMIRFYSTCRSGIEELHQIFKDLGFHPNEIKKEEESRGRITYNFTIPAEEHVKFIDEIGSYKPKHILIFKEYKRRLEDREKE
ncbi:MAG: LAGLIDADG family homing endonuclease [Thermoproteota archaeon]